MTRTLSFPVALAALTLVSDVALGGPQLAEAYHVAQPLLTAPSADIRLNAPDLEVSRSTSVGLGDGWIELTWEVSNSGGAPTVGATAMRIAHSLPGGAQAEGWVETLPPLAPNSAVVVTRRLKLGVGEHSFDARIDAAQGPRLSEQETANNRFVRTASPRVKMLVDIELQQIIVVDPEDVNGSAQPYLWPLFFRVDMPALKEASDPDAWTQATLGYHNNLGGAWSAGEVIPVPEVVGSWSTELRPIPIGDSKGSVGLVVALLEEDDGPVHRELRSYYLDDFVPEVQQNLQCRMVSEGEGLVSIPKLSCPQGGGGAGLSPDQALMNTLTEKFDHWIVDVDDVVGASVLTWTWEELEAMPMQPFARKWDRAHGSEDGSYVALGLVRARIVAD